MNDEKTQERTISHKSCGKWNCGKNWGVDSNTYIGIANRAKKREKKCERNAALTVSKDKFKPTRIQ